MGLFNTLAQQAGETGSSVTPVGIVDQNGNPISSNANGQNTMVNSAPVVLPSDQFRLAAGDGAGQAGTPEFVPGLYSSGGPKDSTGKPQQLAVDRMRALQGKQADSGTITTSVAGDANLVFSSAPKTIMPGQTIMLTGAAASEVVYVQTSYTPSSSTTTIPLQANVVQSGHTTAKWSVFGVNGPGTGQMYPDGIPVFIQAIQDGSNTTNATVSPLYIPTNGNIDGINPRNSPAMSPFLWDGSSSNRQRGNLDVTLLASAARTTTQTSADITNYNGRGIKIWLDMTVVGTGSVTLTINGKDPASGKYILLLSGVAVTTNITSVYTIYPGAPVTANVSVNDLLPRTFQIVVTANNANSATYSVGYSIIV